MFYVDDNSPDQTALRAYASVNDNFPALKEKIVFLRQRSNLGALSNRDSTIKEHCPQRSIVVDVDADDGLLGKQVLNALNRIYQGKDNPWMVYPNFIMQRIVMQVPRY